MKCNEKEICFLKNCHSNEARNITAALFSCSIKKFMRKSNGIKFQAKVSKWYKVLRQTVFRAFQCNKYFVKRFWNFHRKFNENMSVYCGSRNMIYDENDTFLLPAEHYHLKRPSTYNFCVYFEFSVPK